jgi:hypothetical protein
MSKRNRRTLQQRSQAKPTIATPALIQAAHRVAAAIADFAAVADRDTQLRGVLELPYLYQRLYDEGFSGEAATAARQLEKAWRIIASDEPVSDSLQQRRSPTDPSEPVLVHDDEDDRVVGFRDAADATYRWRGPLAPLQLIRAAAQARPDDPSYRVQLARNDAFHAAQVYDGEAHCGRPTKAGGRCAFVPVWMPGQGFADGAPCYRHMTEAETEQACAIYDAAVAAHLCPGCDAPAGTACNNDRAVPVDGAWPRIRSYRGRRVHDARLNLTRQELPILQNR